MGAFDTILKVSVVVGIALASSAVAYHYVVYIPERDAAAESARQAESARTLENERLRNEIDARRAASEKLKEEQRKLDITTRYNSCIQLATINYSENWDGNCKRVDDLKRKNHEDCQRNNVNSQFKVNCDTIYPLTPKGESCALPNALADSLNKGLEQSKNRCLQEMQAGLR
jgi:hypothetical protein